jgi:hypothetical protein
LGGVLLFVIAWEMRPVLERYGMVEAPTSLIGIIAFSLACAFACVALAFVVILMLRLLTAPNRLYWQSVQRCDDLNAKLIAIGQERPLAYENAQFRVHLKFKKAKQCDLSVTVNFKNSGDRMLRWRMASASFEANGISAPFIPISQYNFVNKGQMSWFNYPAIKNVSCNSWPIVATVMFELGSVPT